MRAHSSTRVLFGVCGLIFFFFFMSVTFSPLAGE